MNALVPIAVALFIAAAAWSLRAFGPRRGVMVSLVYGWLFLPVFDGRLAIPLLTTKMTFVPTVILGLTLVADAGRWRRLRLHWVDLVAATVFLGPFVTALTNDLGAWEAISSAMYAFFAWTSPYLLGRLYCGSPAALALFARTMVEGALVYVPLCLWEIRMSPQLHRIVYGYHTFENFGFAVRFGGYRPTVFMQFGLMVGTLMGSGAVLAYWLWRTRAERRIFGLSLGACTAILTVTTVLVKSTGAIILMLVGMGALEATRALRRPIFVVVLALTPVVFVGARISGWTAPELVKGAGLVNAERAQSVEFRIMQEERLIDKAMQRPLLGWGRWGRSRVFDEDGKDVTVTDSLWIIVLGTTGMVGLSALGLYLLLPTLLLVRRHRASRWGRPELAPAAGVAMITVLWVVDCLLNAMTTPLFPAAAGATLTFVVERWSARRRGPVVTARGSQARPVIPAT
jgi:hypothetical protein